MPKMMVHTLSLLTDNEKLLFTQFYRYGISDGTEATNTLIDDIYQDNKQQHYLWLNDILLTLKDWLAAYRMRRGDFDLSEGKPLISDYLLRRLAGQQTSLASASLGVGVKSQTDMRPMQLIGLGCSLRVFDGKYQAQTLLLDNKTHTPLLLHSTWQTAADNNAQQPHHAQSPNALNPIVQQYRATRQQRIAANITLAELQHGQLSIQRSRRSANHSITLNKSRRAYNQLTPHCISAETLAALPAPLHFASIAQLRQHYKTRALSFSRARHQQPNFVILPIDELLFIGYDPAKQTLGALVQASKATVPDEQDATANTPYWIKMSYRSHSPFALALLAETFNSMRTANSAKASNFSTSKLSSDEGANDSLPHHVSGTLSWERFGDTLLPVITPWAIFCRDRRVVLALDLPKHLDKPSSNNNQATGSQKNVASIDWQDSPALSNLPLVDFSHDKYAQAAAGSANDLIHSTLVDCQNWLDEALIYGAESLPTSFWQTQRQLIVQAQQAGLQQLATSLKRIGRSTVIAPKANNHTDDLSISDYLLMLTIQLAVISEMATIMSY